MLPDTSGVELVLRLRESLAGVPAIFAAGRPEIPGIEDIAPPLALLRKPYGENDLRRAVLAMLAPE